MKKKTITAIKRLEKLTPSEKAVAFTAGAVSFPLALTLEVYKGWNKKHGGNKRRRRKWL